MSNVPEDLRYTEDHEWAKLATDGTVKIGITDHAQRELGDVVFVELPGLGSRFAADEACGSIESVKAVAELYCPISGEVIARNEALDESPESINDDPYGAWIFTIRPDSAADLNRRLDAAAYTKLLTESE